MKKYEIVVHQTIVRSLYHVVDAENWEDARDQWHSLDDDDMEIGCEKLLDSDFEINEVQDD